MIKNVLAGLPEEATNYLVKNTKDLLIKKVFDRVGPIGALELYQYELIDGGVAQEFCQTIIKSNNKNLYFVGLKINKQMIVWKSKELKDYLTQNLPE